MTRRAGSGDAVKMAVLGSDLCLRGQWREVKGSTGWQVASACSGHRLERNEWRPLHISGRGRQVHMRGSMQLQFNKIYSWEMRGREEQLAESIAMIMG
jgi:hypothetical protein